MIILSDDGPYQLGGRTWSFRAPAPLSNADLTIKAEAGVRPVLKFASDARPGRSPADEPAPLRRRPCDDRRVCIRSGRRAARRARGRHPNRCHGIDSQGLLVPADQFAGRSKRRRHSGSRSQSSRPSSSDRPPAVFVDMCHFDGGQTGILRGGRRRFLPCEIARWAPASHRSGSTTRGLEFAGPR